MVPYPTTLQAFPYISLYPHLDLENKYTITNSVSKMRKRRVIVIHLILGKNENLHFVKFPDLSLPNRISFPFHVGCAPINLAWKNQPKN